VNAPCTTIGSTFYCHKCAEDRGMLAGLHLTSSSPSQYQVQKALKHLGPTSTYTGVNSVLNSPSTGDLDYYSRKAIEEGFLEVEANGSRTSVYQAPHEIGTQFHSTQPMLSLNSFRWVLSTSSSLAHGRPDSSTRYDGIECSACGSAVTS
jgi:hypothetical protein